LKLAQLGMALCLTLVAARPALSQRAAPPRPSSGGLFGATRSDVGSAHKLNFMAEIAEGFDSDLPPELASRIPTNVVQSGGFLTVFDATADYSHTVKRVRLAGSASTAFRYYQDLDRLDAISHTAGIGANVKLPKGGNLQFDQAAAYSPSYLYQLFPVDNSEILGGAIQPNPDYQIAETDSYLYTTRMELSFGSARGTQARVFGTLNRTDYQSQAATFADLDTYETGAAISHHVSPSGAFSAGYTYRSGEYGSDGRSEEHRLTIGAEYSPALSRTRRATFRVELTPTRFNGPQQPSDAIVANPVNANRFFWSGEASASYPFRPNWTSTARYRRDTQYLSVLGQPTVADAARIELSGLLSRRIDLGALAGYATTASVLNETDQTLETYTAQVSVRYALKRSIALYSEYLYYYYDQRGQDLLVPGFPAVFKQHGIRAGVAFFIEPLGR
jgi:hypothetical protein